MAEDPRDAFYAALYGVRKHLPGMLKAEERLKYVYLEHCQDHGCYSEGVWLGNSVPRTAMTSHRGRIPTELEVARAVLSGRDLVYSSSEHDSWEWLKEGK